ncbi:MAG: hypothetical protein ACR2OE_11805 [Thermomicrobiales bacterium]
MARKPSVGADANAWGTLLNDFLDVEHNSDGTLKNPATPLTDANINAAATTINAKVARTYPATVGTDGQVLGKAGGVPAWVAGGGGTDNAFTVTGDGSNQTAALATALAAARDSATKKTVRILGTVLIDAHPNGGSTGLVVYSGCTLEGVGYSSCLKINPSSVTSSVTSGNMNWGVNYQDNVTIRYLRVDGSRGAIDSSTWSSYRCTGIGGAWDTPRNRVAFDHVWVHDIGGKGMEAFAIGTGGGDTDVTASYLWTWNNDGSGGISLNGDPPSTTRGSKAEISHLYSWGNGWMGQTSFGFNNIRYSDCHAWGNTGNGFNTEWSGTVDFYDCVSDGNTGCGYNVYGDATVRYHNTVSTGNNIGDVYLGGEFAFQWNNDIGNISVPARIDIYGGTITPLVGKPHVTIQLISTPTMNKWAPDVHLYHPDAASWAINYNGYPDSLTYAGVIYHDLPTVAPVRFGPITAWTAGGVTPGTYGGIGALGATPVTLAAAAQYSNLVSPYILTAGRTYLIEMRLQLAYRDRGWALDIRNATTDAAGGISTGTSHAARDVGQWFILDRVITVSSTGPAFLRWVNLYVGTNTIHVDYMNVTELPSLGTSYAIPSGKGVVVHGATAGAVRPTGYGSVEWIGSATPTNMANGDTWVVTP